jgi:phage terminase small subunit
MNKKLTPAQIRRRAFAEHVAAGMSATEAYIRAGYNSKGHAAESAASTLLRNVEVQEIIRSAAEKASKGRIITAQRRREILSEIAEGVTAAVAKGPMGETSRGPLQSERVAAIKHLDELDGLIRQKVEHSGPNGAPIGAVLATVDESTIRARIAELAKRKTK